MRRRRSFKRTAVTLVAGAAIVYFRHLGFCLGLCRRAGDDASECLAAATRSASPALMWFSHSSLTGLAIGEHGSQPADPPWLMIDAVDADLSLMQLIRGDMVNGTVTLRHAHVNLHFDREGRLLTRMPEPKGEEGGAVLPKCGLPTAS